MAGKKVAKKRSYVTYSRDVANEICRRIAEGEPLKTITDDAGMPSRASVINWIYDPDSPGYLDGFSERYQAACRARAMMVFDEMLEIADDSSSDFKTIVKNGKEKVVVDHENIQRDRLRVDTRKWFLAKLYPKVFADRRTVDHTGTVGVQRLPDSELDKRIQALQKQLGHGQEEKEPVTIDYDPEVV